ncbi:MAG: MerR family transcriptional regulator [Sphingobium sp.]|nr:MerR family transcriptional regulator [Sphingobium sp.]
MDKADGAFLTIGELAEELGVAQHILRYWESRFPQLKPLQRSGNRRYYRPGDVLVAKRINQLLNEQGFTVRGAQRVLDGKSEPEPAEPAPPLAPQAAAPAFAGDRSAQPELALGGERRPAFGAASQIDGPDIALLIARLTVIRENLKEAINAD